MQYARDLICNDRFGYLWNEADYYKTRNSELDKEYKELHKKVKNLSYDVFDLKQCRGDGWCIFGKLCLWLVISIIALAASYQIAVWFYKILKCECDFVYGVFRLICCIECIACKCCCEIKADDDHKVVIWCRKHINKKCCTVGGSNKKKLQTNHEDEEEEQELGAIFLLLK